VAAIGAHVEVHHRQHRAEIELAIEVRKQLLIARALPAQCAAERVAVDLDQEQRALPEIVLAQGLGNLGRGREMDETVARIVRAAPVDTLPFRLAPGRGRTDFVDLDHRSRSPVCSLSLLGFFVSCGSSKPGRDRNGRPLRTQGLEPFPFR